MLPVWLRDHGMHGVVADLGVKEAGRAAECRAQFAGRGHHRPGQGAIVGLAVMVFEHQAQAVPAQGERRRLRRREGPKAVLPVQAAEQGIEREAEADPPGGARGVVVDGQPEGDQLHQLGRVGQQVPPFAQRLAHQGELPGLEITQAAVDQLARAARSGAAHGGLFQHDHPITGRGRRLCHSRPLDAATDH